MKSRNRPTTQINLDQAVTNDQIDQVFDRLGYGSARTCDRVIIQRTGGTVAVLLDYLIDHWEVPRARANAAIRWVMATNANPEVNNG